MDTIFCHIATCWLSFSRYWQPVTLIGVQCSWCEMLSGHKRHTLDQNMVLCRGAECLQNLHTLAECNMWPGGLVSSGQLCSSRW